MSDPIDENQERARTIMRKRRAELPAMLRDPAFANVAIEMAAADRIDDLERAVEEARNLVDGLDPATYTTDEWDDLMTDYPTLWKEWGEA